MNSSSLAKIRIKTLQIIYLLVLIFASIFVPINYYRGLITIMIVDLAFAGVCIIGLIWTTVTGKIQGPFALLLLMAISFIIFLGGFQSQIIAYFWIYSFPLTIFFLLGIKAGKYINLIFLAIIMAVSFLSPPKEIIKYNEISIVISLAFVILLTYVYEHVRKSLEIELTKTTLTDALTGIYNRRKFDEVIHEELLRAQRYKRVFSVLSLDIDHFKEINDTFGHDAGDTLLKQFCNIVIHKIRTVDFFFRIGGDEFMILAVETRGDPQALIIAQKLIEALGNETWKINVAMGLSIGVTEYKNGDTVQKIMDRVDKALYTAKRNGKNQSCIEL